MAFKDQVEDYISTFSDTTALDNWLTAGAKKIVDLLPVSKLEKYTVNISDSGNGVTITGHRLLRAHKGGYSARQIDAGLKIQALPSGSLATVSIVNGGTGYSVNDVLTLEKGTGGTCTVTAVSGGVVTAIEITTGGSGYTMGIKTTTVSPPGGSGCTIYVIPSNSSIHQATNTDPVFYIENGILHILPGGGTGIGIAYPTVVNTDTAITGFPQEFENLVILYAAIQARIQQLTTLAQTTLGGLSLATEPTVPTPPSAPNFIYTNAIGSTIVATTIGSLGIAPTYTKPILSLTSAPSSLDLSSITPPAITAPDYNYVDAVSSLIPGTTIDESDLVAPIFDSSVITYPSISFPISIDIIPTNPGAPSFTHNDIVASSSTLNNLISELDTYFTTTLDDASNGYINGVKDIELAGIKINEIQAKLTEIRTELEIGLQQAIRNADSSNDIAKSNAAHQLQKEVQEYDGKLKRYSEELNEYQSRLSKVKEQYQLQLQGEIQRTRAQIDVQLGKFNEDLELYKAKLQIAITNANLEYQKNIENARLSTDVNLKNKYNNLNSDISLYEHSLKKYVEDLTKYQYQVNSKVQEYRANLDRIQVIRATELQEYSANIQNELNKFNKEATEYQSTVQKSIQQAQITLQEALEQARLATDVDTKNKAENLAKQVQEYQASLNKYLNEIQSYNAQVNRAVSNYGNSIQKIVSQHQVMMQELEAMKREYNEYLKIHLGVNYGE